MPDLRVLLSHSHVGMDFGAEAEGDLEGEDTETEGDQNVGAVGTFGEGPSSDDHIQKAEEDNVGQRLNPD